MKELDTIREAQYQIKFERISELMFQKGVPQEAFDLLADIHPARIRNEALAALSAIDPDAKPQEPSEDARDVAMSIMAHQEMWLKGKNFYTINDAAASIEAYATTHDDAIRLECADRAEIEINEQGLEEVVSIRRLRSAILGKETKK